MSAVCKLMEDMKNQKAQETRLDAIQKMMTKLKLTVEQAMDVLDIPPSERMSYLERIDAK